MPKHNFNQFISPHELFYPSSMYAGPFTMTYQDPSYSPFSFLPASNTYFAPNCPHTRSFPRHYRCFMANSPLPYFPYFFVPVPNPENKTLTIILIAILILIALDIVIVRPRKYIYKSKLGKEKV